MCKPTKHRKYIIHFLFRHHHLCSFVSISCASTFMFNNLSWAMWAGNLFSLCYWELVISFRRKQGLTRVDEGEWREMKVRMSELWMKEERVRMETNGWIVDEDGVAMRLSKWGWDWPIRMSECIPCPFAAHASKIGERVWRDAHRLEWGTDWANNNIRWGPTSAEE